MSTIRARSTTYKGENAMTEPKPNPAPEPLEPPIPGPEPLPPGDWPPPPEKLEPS